MPAQPSYEEVVHLVAREVYEMMFRLSGDRRQAEALTHETFNCAASRWSECEHADLHERRKWILAICAGLVPDSLLGWKVYYLRRGGFCAAAVAEMLSTPVETVRRLHATVRKQTETTTEEDL